MRVLVSLLASAVLCAPATAQIYKVEFKDPKKSKNFKNHSIEVNGELFLVGEAKSGISLDEANNKINYKGDQVNELWVPDMDNPKACPYKLQRGEKVKAGGKASVSINGPDIKSISIFIRDQSLYGLSKEYARRDEDIDQLRKERDSFKKGTAEWRAKQTALIQTMERMRSWLDETLYSRAAKKVAREIETEMKAAKEASAQRLELAKASIKMVEPPSDLVAIAKEVYGDAIVFHQQESLHTRFIYREELGDERIHGLVELAETIIDGFRGQFIDPYVTDDFKDYMRDELFIEWYFGPDDVILAEQFEKKYYGIVIEGENREKRLKSMGHSTRRKDIVIYACKVSDQTDLEGNVAHTLGHRLANIHYNQDRASDPSDWLYEGMGNWLSLEYLGRNSVQCISFDVGKYARPSKGDNSEESGLLMGTADIYHRLALEEGPKIDLLAIKQLAEFGDPDIAKAYSVFNYVAKTQAEKGQRWLRACCNAAAVPASQIPQWRKKSEELYQVTGEDIFKKIEGDWKAFAEGEIGGPVSSN